MKLKRRGLIATIVYHALLLFAAGVCRTYLPRSPAGGRRNPGEFRHRRDRDLAILNPWVTTSRLVTRNRKLPRPPRKPAEEYVEPVEESTPAYTPPDPTPIDQTQDVEEVKVKEKPKPTPEEIERQRQAELERQRLAEVERQRIELERQREGEAGRTGRIQREQQARAEQLNNMGRDAFGRQGVGETEGSEGITQGSGNQGVTNGSPDADRYDTGGGLGDGISFGGLGSRTGSLPKPNMAGCDITQKIEVKVEIQVDKEGRVVAAIVQSATYQNKCIWDMVVEAAKKSRFSADQSANYRQTGWIKYIIVP